MAAEMWRRLRVSRVRKKHKPDTCMTIIFRNIHFLFWIPLIRTPDTENNIIKLTLQQNECKLKILKTENNILKNQDHTKEIIHQQNKWIGFR
jgi:hypothetical protein